MAMECSCSTRVALLALALALAASHISRHAGPAAVQRGEADVVIVHLKTKGQVEAALALQAPDLSLAGFSNRSDHCHAFPGHGHVLVASEWTLLPFGNTYRDLIGGLANLPGLPLGRGPTARAVSVLSAYDPATADADAVVALKRALATLIASTVEPRRLRPVLEAVSKGWESGEARVGPELLPYIEHWECSEFPLWDLGYAACSSLARAALGPI